MHFLTEAKLRGFAIPMSVYSAGISYLREIAAREVNDLQNARLTAYAIYILTRNEIVTTNYLTNLQLTLNQHKGIVWQKDITSAYMAATYQLLKNSNEANSLIALYAWQGSKNAADNDFNNQAIANAQYLYLLALHFPGVLQHIDAGLMASLVAAMNDNTVSTVLSGYTALALGAYNEAPGEQGDEQLALNELFANGQEKELSVSGTDLLEAMIDPAVTEIKFKNAAKLTYFYQLLQAGFDKNLPTRVINNGIEVMREITSSDNKTISNTNVGDELVVHLRARSLDGQYHSNVALVDLLPGGFEVVRSSINQQEMDYVDMREDRVIFFGTIGTVSKEITYRIKATNAGKFVVPPVFGASMYNPIIKSQGVPSSIKVDGGFSQNGK